MNDIDQVARLKNAVDDLRATVGRLDERNKALAAQIASHNEAKRERAEATATQVGALQAQLAEQRQTYKDNSESAKTRYQENAESAKARHQNLLTKYQRVLAEKADLTQRFQTNDESVRASVARDRDLAAQEMELVRGSAQALNTVLQQEVAMLRGLNGDFLSPPTRLVVASTSSTIGLGKAALEGIANLAERSLSQQTTSQSEQGDSPIIVAGCPRSGTTLLQALVCSHNDTWPMTPEASPVTVLAVAAEWAAIHADRSPDGALPASAVVDDKFGAFARDLLESSPVGQGGKRPVLKHPVMTAHLPKVLRLLPTASMVAIVRDPRAIFASCRSWGERAALQGVEHPFHSLDDLGLCHLLWGYLRPLAQLANTDAALSVIRYEKLVIDPEHEMARVAPELGLTNEFELSQNWKTGTTQSDSAHLTSLYGSPPNASSLDSWKSTLGQNTRSVVEAAFRPWIEAFDL